MRTLQLAWLLGLVVAAAQEMTIFQLARDGTLDEIQAAIAAGADVNARDAYGQTPLMYAAGANSPAVIEALIAAGAEVNAHSGAGWTALMYAARDNPHPGVLIALLEHGADPNAVLYDVYFNGRFTYFVEFPLALLIPQGEPDNGDGQRFIANDGRAQMAVFGSHNTLGMTIEQAYQQAITFAGTQPTYQVLRDDWFVISGYLPNGRIYYQKTFLIEDIFRTVWLEYQPELRRLYDAVTERVSRSLIVLREDDCEWVRRQEVLWRICPVPSALGR